MCAHFLPDRWSEPPFRLIEDSDPRSACPGGVAGPVVPQHAWFPPCKAGVDWLVALALLTLTSPVLLFAALLIKLTSRGSAVYRQMRVGRGGREFVLYKLRTMVADAENGCGPVWAESEDSRVTSVGRVLRAAHLDELPQLANVLLGQMSLIGPRPERPEFVADLIWTLPGYANRLAVRPGITGFAQIRLPPDASVECVRRKLVYDLYYVRFMNPWLDLRIGIATFWHILVHLHRGVMRCLRLPSWNHVRQQVPLTLIGEAEGDPDPIRSRPKLEIHGDAVRDV